MFTGLDRLNCLSTSKAERSIACSSGNRVRDWAILIDLGGKRIMVDTSARYHIEQLLQFGKTGFGLKLLASCHMGLQLNFAFQVSHIPKRALT